MTEQSTATSNGSERNSKKLTQNSIKSKLSTESAIAIKSSKGSPERSITDIPKRLFPLFRKLKPSSLSEEEHLNQPVAERWTASSEKMSSLTVRIIAVNIIAIMILAAGVLYLGEYTDSLVEGELDSMRAEARFVSDALSEGTVRPVFQVSPIPFNDPFEIEAIKPSLARNMLSRLGKSSKSHIKLFGVDNSLLIDTDKLLHGEGHVEKIDLNKKLNLNIGELFDQSAGRFTDAIPTQTKLANYPAELIDNIYRFPDTGKAMSGEISASAWKAKNGQVVLTAAAPIQKIKQVLGVIVLTRDGSELEQKIQDIRVDVFKVFLGTLGVTVMLSIYLSGLIGKPLKTLALAAERVRLGKGQDIEIPDMSQRGDEIGELSLVLREMTQALRDRMDTIERFAADVSHEIKNPLTSLRSAVETAAKIKDEDKREKLMGIIHHDVQRLDRLISDISSASRLDAELTRDEMKRVNVVALLYRLKDAYKDPIARADGEEDETQKIIIHAPNEKEFMILGNEERLVQVFGNLISNALSFLSKENGKIEVSIDKQDKGLVISIEDNGPGIPENKIATIFDRFYTERPHESYGGHSGLGLSISKQIIDAHEGKIWAENRRDKDGDRTGAVFKVKLQAA